MTAQLNVQETIIHILTLMLTDGDPTGIIAEDIKWLEQEKQAPLADLWRLCDEYGIEWPGNTRPI